MPLAESNTAAAITFDAAVHRALARRLSDTPYPRDDSHAHSAPRTGGESAAADPAAEPAR